MHYLSHLLIFLCAIAVPVLAGKGCSAGFKQDFLAANNAKRVIHQVDPLALDGKLNIIAEDWASHLAEIGHSENRPNTTYGEILWNQTGSAAPPDGKWLVNWWYDSSEKYYNFTQPNMTTFEYWGTFTQMVWKATKNVGVGCAGTADEYFVVANYDPPGNFEGQYLANVLPPKKVGSK